LLYLLPCLKFWAIKPENGNQEDPSPKLQVPISKFKGRNQYPGIYTWDLRLRILDLKFI